MKTLAGAVKIGARMSGTDPKLIDVVGITAQAEAVVAQITALSEATVRTIIRNTIASPHHPSWFEAETDWRDSLVDHIGLYLKHGSELKPYWITRRRPLVVIDGGCAPERRRRARLRLLQGGAG